MTGLLASVATLAEMETARRGGADIVDLKNPARGALGAWPIAALKDAVALWSQWGERRPELSATIGDHPMAPATVLAAAASVAATGVPLVKLGVFADGDPAACFTALAPLATRTKLIAVFFGDLGPDPSLIARAAKARFHGVMLDTADKSAGGLRAYMSDDELRAFVAAAKAQGLLTGLAGSLKPADIVPLSPLAPDYLGFRGALCSGGRTGELQEDAVADVARLIRRRRRAA